jgi:uncharacterized repeat protein (TIGR03803 family)
VRDPAGNLYGTTTAGGAQNAGVVYKVHTSGQETVLHTFTGGADGDHPSAGVILDSAGNLYGTTYWGGTANAGVVYDLDASGQETVLRNFTGGADGGYPTAGVIRDSAGNLYGTTYFGGAGNGVVYKLDAAGQETVLYSFTGGADGGNPYAGVIRDSAGNLYGTTKNGGGTGVAGSCATSCGVVFKLDTTGHETVLHVFTGLSDGAQPDAGVIRDSAGNLYGTSGAVVYKVDTTGHLTVLCTLGGGTYAGVIGDPAGNLYGTTDDGPQGGATCSGMTFAGCGLVFKLDKAGKETVLYTFTGGADGGVPYAGLIRDSAGNLYGTTSGGGTENGGVVYKVDPSGQQTVLHSFPGPVNGASPVAGVVRGPAGNFYGATTSGGVADAAGVVYKVDTAGHATALYSFTGGADGGTPIAGVVLDSAGNLYGTTTYGGITTGTCSTLGPGCGVVYKVDTAGHETVLYSFTGGADGGYPYAGVIRDSAGNLYGTTEFGGIPSATNPFGDGVVYKVDTAGQETVLHSFTGPPDGAVPTAGVIRDSAGNLYGTTASGGIFIPGSLPPSFGVVYKLNAAGQETLLYTFTGDADGGSPAGLLLDSAGNLYGTTFAGGNLQGTSGYGVVYKLDTAGHQTVLHSFTGGADGAYPAGVIRDSTGNLYGTTQQGGANCILGCGVVFRLDPAGNETVLYSFTGLSDGGFPDGGVIRDSAGNLYGTTNNGGENGGGVLFKLAPH